jgi:predicted DNA-binding antitoxin AbrB/MazE fold protein
MPRPVRTLLGGENSPAAFWLFSVADTSGLFGTRLSHFAQDRSPYRLGVLIMATTVDTTYENGRLTFKQRLDLPEGTPVRVTITPLAVVDDPLAGVIGKLASGRTDWAANHNKFLYGKCRR